jgi:hypothetical protein
MPKGFTGDGSDTLFVTQSAHPLVVAAIFAGSGQKVTSTFSHWGEPVAPKTPTNWIAVNQL